MSVDINYILTELMKLAIPVVAGFVAMVLKKHGVLKTLESKQKYAKLAVQFAQEVYKDEDGATKYKHASNWLSSQLKAVGIKVSGDEIRGLVQAAYNEFKKDFEKKVDKPQSKPQVKQMAKVESVSDPGSGGR